MVQVAEVEDGFGQAGQGFGACVAVGLKAVAEVSEVGERFTEETLA
jgi:hypothetical protein